MRKTCQEILAFVAFVSFFSCFCGLAQPPLKVRVLKDNTNLRARPALEAEVAGQVSADQELFLKSMDADWVEVVAPASVDFWILGDYLKDGVVACSQKVNVRAGPGINFSVVGRLQNGDLVEVRGSHGEWIKIAPPENCSLWISRPLVEIVSQEPQPSPKPATAKPRPTPEPAVEQLPAARPAETGSVQPEAAVFVKPEKAPEAPETARSAAPSVLPRAVKPAEPAVVQGEKNVLINPPEGLNLLPDVPQGQFKQYEGVLHRRNFIIRTPSDFRLVAENEDGSSRTLCFVFGNKSQLDALLFRKLAVSGRQYWVKRQRYPVLVPEKIILK